VFLGRFFYLFGASEAHHHWMIWGNVSSLVSWVRGHWGPLIGTFSDIFGLFKLAGNADLGAWKHVRKHVQNAQKYLKIREMARKGTFFGSRARRDHLLAAAPPPPFGNPALSIIPRLAYMCSLLSNSRFSNPHRNRITLQDGLRIPLSHRFNFTTLLPPQRKALKNDR